jgi:ethylmalonyl-CoA/methylmalonyl-CoA decarboxylase
MVMMKIGGVVALKPLGRLVRLTISSPLSSSTTGSAVSLASKHNEFLKRVRDQGIPDGGHIKLAYLQNDTIADIKISNTSKKNAISGVMMNELADIVDEVRNNQKLLGCIIRGDGDFFCSGADLALAKEFVNTPESGLAMSAFMTEALNGIRNADVISVGMLNGPCLGGGAEFSTVGDFRMFCGMATLPPPYICFVQAKLGVTPGWGGASRLLSIVGRKSALRLLGTSMQVDVETALKIGLVDQSVKVSSEAEILDHAVAFFEPFSKQRFPDAVKAMKRIIAESDLNPLQGAITESRVFGERWGGKDNSSALKAGGAKKK